MREPAPPGNGHEKFEVMVESDSFDHLLTSYFTESITFEPITKHLKTASDVDIFLESWIWILHEDDGSGYELELTFHGRLEEEPRCYYYNINYIEH